MGNDRFVKLDAVPFAYRYTVEKVVGEVALSVRAEEYTCWVHDESRCEIRKAKDLSQGWVQIAFCEDSSDGTHVSIMTIIRDVPRGFNPVSPRVKTLATEKVYLPHPWSLIIMTDLAFAQILRDHLLTAYTNLP